MQIFQAQCEPSTARCVLSFDYNPSSDGMSALSVSHKGHQYVWDSSSNTKIFFTGFIDKFKSNRHSFSCENFWTEFRHLLRVFREQLVWLFVKFLWIVECWRTAWKFECLFIYFWASVERWLRSQKRWVFLCYNKPRSHFGRNFASLASLVRRNWRWLSE